MLINTVSYTTYFTTDTSPDTIYYILNYIDVPCTILYTNHRALMGPSGACMHTIYYIIYYTIYTIPYTVSYILLYTTLV